MPYVKQKSRPGLDKLVEQLQHLNIDGDLNYVLFALCKRHVKPSYNNYKNFCGELDQCKTEIERRILASYEDEKIRTNGDVC